MWSDRFLLWIFERFPPEYDIFTEAAGRAESEFESETEAAPFSAWFGMSPTELFDGREVLDVGSGYGGRPVRYLDYGACRVAGVEISEKIVASAREFALERGVDDRLDFAVGTGERIPYASDSFDLITMYDVLEHVISPAEVLDECHRVLRPGGRAAIVFPPYYDVLGGSHLHGYATRIPGLNLVFSTRALKSAGRQLFERKGIDYGRWLREVPSDKLWNMNGITVRGFRRLLDERAFEVEQLRLYGHRDRRIPTSGQKPLPGVVHAALEAGAEAPLLREVLCLRVCALLRK